MELVKRSRVSRICVVVTLGLMWALQSNLTTQQRNILYSEFKQRLGEGAEAEESVGQTRITGRFKGKDGKPGAVFETLRIEDRALVKELEQGLPRAREVLEARREQVERVAACLLEPEQLEGDELRARIAWTA